MVDTRPKTSSTSASVILPFSTRRIEVLAVAGDGALERFGVDVVERHFVAVEGALDGDLGAHLAGAGDTDLADVVDVHGLSSG